MSGFSDCVEPLDIAEKVLQLRRRFHVLNANCDDRKAQIISELGLSRNLLGTFGI